ncbi:MAG TPA: efflux RND transporter periplasmic adaptor subunit [Longimicrobiales bacterium]|nr:efflux RND transporter periplasmic adaptor subunit [Longimicrobiales bacterium]
MTSRKQVLFSLALVGTSLAVVAGVAFTSGDGARAAASDGHDHAAMSAAGDQQPVILDAEAARRIGVTYVAAVLRPFERTVNAAGSVTWDETRLTSVNTKIEGWIERLHVDYTGAPVRRGQPLMSVYSPMLVSAQEELILARRLVDQTEAGGSARAGINARELLESARRRLRYWDIPESVVREIEQSGTPRRTLPLYATSNGVVVEKMVVDGMRIMPGMELYRIADLSRIWVEAEVFEKDLSAVHIGQTASVRFDAYPGEAFVGTVGFVNPVLSPESRTARIRVELPNPQLRLMPGMYGRVDLAAPAGEAQLIVPRHAVHFTGERALVFLRAADGALVPRTITPGPMSGSELVVLAGLLEGDVIVASAGFLIDAESRLGTLGGQPAAPGTTNDHGAAAGPPAPAPPTGHDDHSGHTGH